MKKSALTVLIAVSLILSGIAFAENDPAQPAQVLPEKAVQTAATGASAPSDEDPKSTEVCSEGEKNADKSAVEEIEEKNPSENSHTAATASTDKAPASE